MKKIVFLILTTAIMLFTSCKPKEIIDRIGCGDFLVENRNTGDSLVLGTGITIIIGDVSSYKMEVSVGDSIDFTFRPDSIAIKYDLIHKLYLPDDTIIRMEDRKYSALFVVPNLEKGEYIVSIKVNYQEGFVYIVGNTSFKMVVL